jgi:hypothetical protein
MAALPCLAGMESGFAISSAQQQDQADGMRDGNEHTQEQEERRGEWRGGEGRREEERGGPGGRGRTRYADTEAPPSLEGVTAGYFEGSAPPPSWPRMDAGPLGHSRRWERIWDHWATGCHLESWTPGCRVGGWPGRASVHTAHCAPHTAPQRSGPEGDWRWVGLHGRASGGG